MSHPEDVREVLISIATAALLAAQADAEQSGKLIFRDEWKPTPRFRNSTTQLPSQVTAPTTGAHSQSYSWITIQNGSNVYRIPLPWLEQPSPSTPTPDAPAPAPAPASVLDPDPASASEPVSAPVSPPPPKAAGVPVSSAPPDVEVKPEPQGFVAKLLEDNHVVYSKLINHPFPQSLGNGSASLDGFRYYMIQDTKYLELCARLKMLAVARLPDFKAIEDFEPRHKSSLEYVKNSKEFLSSWLGVPESTISATPRDKCLDASEKHYIESTQNEDAWLAYYVVLLPCVLSYWKIADRLMNTPSTVRNTVYFPTWIENNYDSHSADKYIKFLDANIKAKGGDIERWNFIFQMACQLEADIFDTGLQAPMPYLIVPQGTYSIQNFSATGVVLADHNVESSGSGSSIVGLKKPGGKKEKWNVVATKGGYTFQNVGTGLYLGIDIRKEGRVLQLTAEPYHWWINPVRRQPLWYQIYTSENLRYTLQADIVDGPTNIDPPIATRDNFNGPSQMWSFERVQLESPDVVNPKTANAPIPKSATPTIMQDVASTSTSAKDMGGISTTVNTTGQDMGGQASAVPPGARFYAYIHNIADDNTWRYTLMFTSRDIADQWWRAVSTSTVSVLQNNVQRITPQFYTHDPRQWNISLFFVDPRVSTVADQFRGKFFMALEHDRGGRGISIIPTQSIVDYTSGNWFTIRSRSNPNNYWFYDESQGFVVSSSTQRTSFQITAPDLAVGTILIGTDDITITAQNYGYVTAGTANATGGSCLQVAGASSQVAFRFKFSDLKSGRFIAISSVPGTAILYMPHGGAGSGWELWH